MQKYRLLACLKDVKSSFGESKLYPQLADIVVHYNNLVTFRDSKKLLKDCFPKKPDIMRTYRQLPNTTVYTVEYPLSLPYNETLLPIAKRLLMKHIELT